MTFDKERLKRYLMIFFLAQPFIDLLTSLLISFFDVDISLGMVVRFLFMLVGVIYIFFFCKSSYRKKTLVYFGLAAIYAILYLASNYYFKGSLTLFGEIKYLLKIFYFPVVLLFFINLYKDGLFSFSPKTITRITFTYIFIIFIAQLTGTQFVSYSSDKLGHVGWFYSPNEISAILAVLSPIVIYNIICNRKNIIYFFLTIIYIYAMFIIGTKVPVLAIVITALGFIAGYIIEMILEHKKNWEKIMFPLFTILITAVVLFPITPIGYNMNVHLDWLKVDNVKDLYKPGNSSKLTNIIFNNREKYSADTRDKFNKAPWQQKLIGIGYVDKQGEQNKLVEMDYHDILYRNGIIGFIVFFAPCVIILWTLLKNAISNLRRVIIDTEMYQYIIGLLLALGIAYFSGHVLVAPAVSIYIALVITKLMMKLKV